MPSASAAAIRWASPIARCSVISATRSAIIIGTGWSRDTPHLEEFRRIFGDERRDYDAALQHYYAQGAPADWSEHFISAYASSHPWEDFAETWAHYFHMVDTLETAHVAGLAVNPKLQQSPGAVFDFHPLDTDMDRLVETWLALTFAVNSLNRSMGLHDLYPFVLGPLAVAKLTFVQQLIRTISPRNTPQSERPGAARQTQHAPPLASRDDMTAHDAAVCPCPFGSHRN